MGIRSSNLPRNKLPPGYFLMKEYLGALNVHLSCNLNI